jgi:hypothetical protein
MNYRGDVFKTIPLQNPPIYHPIQNILNRKIAVIRVLFFILNKPVKRDVEAVGDGVGLWVDVFVSFG